MPRPIFNADSERVLMEVYYNTVHEDKSEPKMKASERFALIAETMNFIGRDRDWPDITVVNIENKIDSIHKKAKKLYSLHNRRGYHGPGTNGSASGEAIDGGFNFEAARAEWSNFDLYHQLFYNARAGILKGKEETGIGSYSNGRVSNGGGGTSEYSNYDWRLEEGNGRMANGDSGFGDIASEQEDMQQQQQTETVCVEIPEDSPPPQMSHPIRNLSSSACGPRTSHLPPMVFRQSDSRDTSPFANPSAADFRENAMVIPSRDIDSPAASANSSSSLQPMMSENVIVSRMSNRSSREDVTSAFRTLQTKQEPSRENGGRMPSLLMTTSNQGTSIAAMESASQAMSAAGGVDREREERAPLPKRANGGSSNRVRSKHAFPPTSPENMNGLGRRPSPHPEADYRTREHERFLVMMLDVTSEREERRERQRCAWDDRRERERCAWEDRRNREWRDYEQHRERIWLAEMDRRRRDDRQFYAGLLNRMNACNCQCQIASATPPVSRVQGDTSPEQTSTPLLPLDTPRKANDGQDSDAEESQLMPQLLEIDERQQQQPEQHQGQRAQQPSYSGADGEMRTTRRRAENRID